MSSGVSHLFPLKRDSTIDQILVNNFQRIFKISEEVIKEKHESKGHPNVDVTQIKNSDDLLRNSS